MRDFNCVDDYIEENRLIALFMKEVEPGNWGDVPSYHSDYNALMRVVKEIGTYVLAFPGQVEKFWKASVMTDQSVLWEMCVAFIQWYNQQNKKES